MQAAVTPSNVTGRNNLLGTPRQERTCGYAERTKVYRWCLFHQPPPAQIEGLTSDREQADNYPISCSTPAYNPLGCIRRPSLPLRRLHHSVYATAQVFSSPDRCCPSNKCTWTFLSGQFLLQVFIKCQISELTFSIPIYVPVYLNPAVNIRNNKAHIGKRIYYRIHLFIKRDGDEMTFNIFHFI